MIKNYKSFWKQMGIMAIITFVMSVVLLKYLIDNNIMGYGTSIQGSMTIFGFYLSQIGWVVFLSAILTIAISIVVSTFLILIHYIWIGAVKLFHKLYKTT